MPRALAIFDGPMPFALSCCTDGINRCGTALVDTGSLGLGDAFHLSLFAQVGLELREHPEHIEEALAGRAAGIDRLLGGLQRGALRLHGPNDVLQVSDAAGEPVDPREGGAERNAIAALARRCVNGTTFEG